MPRFSILTLLCITAYIAVIAGAMVRPEGWVLAASRIAWLAVVVYWIARAAQPAQMPKTSFARAAIVGAIAYLFVANSATFTWLPHHALADWLSSRYDMQHMLAAIGPQSEVVILPSKSPDEVQSAMRRMFNSPSQEPGVAASEPAENRETPSAEELNQLLGQVRIEYRDDMNSIFLGNPQQNSRWEGLQDQLDSLDELVLLQTTLALGFTTGLLAHFLHRRDQRTKRANESTPQA